MTTTTVTPRAAPAMSSQERFFKFFQGEVTALEERMQLLESHGTSGGERNDAVDFCLTGISKLTHEVKDASSYLPAYDQRTYSEAIKALSEKLQKTRSAFAPRQKFSFKSGFPRKNASAISIADAAELAANQRLSAPMVSSGESSFAPTPLESPAPERVAGNDGTQAPVAVPSAQNTSLSISNQTKQHIIPAPSTDSTPSTGTLSNLDSCIVDLSKASLAESALQALYLKDISNSLIICGTIDGATHLTRISNSVVVMTTRQFRMHESNDCNVYLYCKSRPIIEECTGSGFAPLPEKWMNQEPSASQNNFDQVDDFNWLKAEASPNWKVIEPEQRIRDEVWKRLDDEQCSVQEDVEDVLKAVGVFRGS